MLVNRVILAVAVTVTDLAQAKLPRLLREVHLLAVAATLDTRVIIVRVDYLGLPFILDVRHSVFYELFLGLWVFVEVIPELQVLVQGHVAPVLDEVV